jgi:hypothetical protein
MPSTFDRAIDVTRESIDLVAVPSVFVASGGVVLFRALGDGGERADPVGS